MATPRTGNIHWAFTQHHFQPAPLYPSTPVSSYPLLPSQSDQGN